MCMDDFMDCVAAKSALLGLPPPPNFLGMKSKGKYPAAGWVDPGFSVKWNHGSSRERHRLLS